jgi:hypothetical protein
MKPAHLCFICAVFVQLTTHSISYAQTPGIIDLKPAPATITIDGNLQEWGDSLNYYNDKTKVRYTLANDKVNLYLIVKTKDALQQANILGSGITFGIDTKGRKRSSFAITFPTSSDEQQSGITTMTTDQLKMRVGVTKYRKILVDGFKDINDGLLSTSNTNGIQIVINYDDHGYLVYEEAIPLALFHADNPANKEWAFNIKVNGLQRTKTLAPGVTVVTESVEKTRVGSSATNKRFGRGDAGKVESPDQSDKVDITSSSNFWGKFNLAKAQ